MAAANIRMVLQCSKASAAIIHRAHCTLRDIYQQLYKHRESFNKSIKQQERRQKQCVLEGESGELIMANKEIEKILKKCFPATGTGEEATKSQE